MGEWGGLAWANKDVLFYTGQLSAVAKSLIRDFSTWPSLGGSQCSHTAEEGGEAEREQSPRVTLGQNQDWDVMFPLPPTAHSDAWQLVPVSSGRHVLCHYSSSFSTNEPLAQATQKVIGMSLVPMLDSLRCV